MRSNIFSNALHEEIRSIIKEVLEEEKRCAEADVLPVPEAQEIKRKLQVIMSKERITVKEAALLLSCSESHVRKLVKLALKGKSRRPIPSVDMEGVTVFPLHDLLEWASPQQQPQVTQDKKL